MWKVIEFLARVIVGLLIVYVVLSFVYRDGHDVPRRGMRLRR